ncbi:MAG: DVU_1555 family C-GCAxxG-C-C protein [Desulfovibrio sp.]|uniref:DVU_1555 family C-GCAxxG-C-C protein n=1 Tax=Desulfovibrio sp. 7SRBS1 TaxID=3378064 RepID=UPI003B3ED384
MSEYLMDVLSHGGGGYCCSQIIIRMGLEAQGEENPALVRAMAGLCHGVGARGGSCGALTGGACLLGLYAGKGKDDEQENDAFALMLSELSDWFDEFVGKAYGGTDCSSIVGEGPPDMQVCGNIVGETYGKVLEILVSHGIDPSESRDSDDYGL